MPSASLPGPRGQKTALTLEQIGVIAAGLANRPRDKAILLLATCSCLRGIDLLSIKVHQIIDHKGIVLDRFSVNVSKLSNYRADIPKRHTHQCFVDSEARKAVQAYLAVTRLAPDDLLFPITPARLRQLVKEWVSEFLPGLDPARYASHSLRRALPTAIWAKTKDIVAAQRLLGHQSTEHVHYYLSVNFEQAVDVAKLVLGD
jgi:site-specific recombinase XerC